MGYLLRFRSPPTRLWGHQHPIVLGVITQVAGTPTPYMLGVIIQAVGTPTSYVLGFITLAVVIIQAVGTLTPCVLGVITLAVGTPRQWGHQHPVFWTDTLGTLTPCVLKIWGALDNCVLGIWGHLCLGKCSQIRCDHQSTGCWCPLITRTQGVGVPRLLGHRALVSPNHQDTGC